MTFGGFVLLAMWVGLIYICLNPEVGVRLGAWLRNRDK